VIRNQLRKPARLFMQQVLGYSPLRTGLAYVPLAVVVAIGAGIASNAAANAPPKAVLALGLLRAAPAFHEDKDGPVMDNAASLAQAIDQANAIIAAMPARDLAAATGRADLLSDDLGTRALAMVTARIPRSPRAHIPFKDVVPVPGNAPVYDRLAGWMGRDPA
jgi:hypothetical protein